MIGIRETPRGEGPATVVGDPVVDRELALDGGTAAFRAYRTREGGGCWFLRARGSFRVNMGGCTPANWRNAPVRVTPQGNPPVVFVGRAREDVDRIVFRFATGEQAEVRPDEHGYVFEPVSSPLQATAAQLTDIIGYDAVGKEVQHERLRRRP